MTVRELVDTKSSVVEFMSIVGPSVCIVHCLATPLLLGLLPIIGTQYPVLGLNEQMLALIVVPLCALALVPGYLKHRQKEMLGFLCAGIVFILFGSFLADKVIAKGSELPISVLGSICLIRAALLNRRFCHCAAHCCQTSTTLPAIKARSDRQS